MARKSVSPGGIGSAIKMVTMFINRAGRNLSATRRRELEKAKRILQEKNKSAPRAGEKEAAMPKKSSGRKYGRKAQSKVRRAMHERKHGKLKSGRSGKKVKSRKQAIAIGLSEARKAGAKVPKRSKK